jgi:hypothetical protein
MKKSLSLITIFLLAFTACWSNTPTVLESVVPVVSNIDGYTGLQDEILEFNLSPTANSKKRSSRFAVASQNLQTSSLRVQSDFIDVPILKARVIAVRKGKVLRPGQVATTTELTAIFDWSSDTPLTGSVTLNGYHPPEYSGAWSYSSVPETGQINTTKTNQNAPGFTGNTFKSKQPGRYECVFASWNLSSGPFQYVQDQPVKLCKQPVKADYRVTLTGPRAPRVGFVSEYEVKTSQSILSAGVLNPVLKIFVPEHATFQGIRWGTYGGGNPFSIQCNPETPAARVIVCTGSSVSFAVFMLLVRHTQALAETFRVELSSDIAERNPADNVASLTVQPFLENTTTDLQVTGNVLTSSSVFIDDSLEQIVTVKNLGPGVAVNAFVLAYLSGQAWGSILPELPAVPLGCVFENSTQIKCPLPVLAVGEEFSLTVPIRAKTATTIGNKLTGYVQYQFDTNTGNNFLTNPDGVVVARDPFKEHALQVSLNAPDSATENQAHTSSVTVTNHGPNATTSRSLVFSPPSLIPVLVAPAGCELDQASDSILCDLSGMPANTSRTFAFTGRASYQMYASSQVRVSLTLSGNDLNSFAQSGYKYVYVRRDPNTVHSLDVAISGLNADYLIGDPISFTTTVTNKGPSASPARMLRIHHYGFQLAVPAGCDDDGYNYECPIPPLAVNASVTQSWSGTASTRTNSAGVQAQLDYNELETFDYNVSPNKSFQVRGQVGNLTTAFTPSPPSSFDIATAQSFTVVVTNNGLFSSVPDSLGILLNRPGYLPLMGLTTSGLQGCDLTISSDDTRRWACAIPPIAPGSSWSFSFTVNDTQTGRFKLEAMPNGDNDQSGLIAYHEVNTTNGLPLALEWKPGFELPSSPPGFVLGQSHPFAVSVSNPNPVSKSFSLEVNIGGTNYDFTLGAPFTCSNTTVPLDHDPGDDVDHIATCSLTLAAGQTSSLFFSANFPDCDYDPPQEGTNCRSTVQISQIKARLIGATATPLAKNVKVNQ